MNVIQEAISAFTKLHDNLETIVTSTIEETSMYLTDDTKEQLFAGLDGARNQITPRYKSARYAHKKYLMNPKPGLFVPDLKYSGKFYEGIFAIVKQPSLFIGSSVDYAGYLEEKYGYTIFEPTRASLNDYMREHFLPTLLMNIEKVCGIKFVND